MGWKQYLVSAVIAYIACFIYYIDFSNVSPLMYLNGVEFMKYYGYEGEEHLIESQDGLYMIKLHRIGKGENLNKSAVLFIPGIHCSSELQFGLGPDYDLSYMLYDNGIDPWMANSRGSHNAEPKENVTLTDDELTNFSFHEIALYDITAQIDFILHKTGQKKLQIISSSMGTAVVMILLSTRPEYNDKVSKVLMLGPSGAHTEYTSFLQLIVVWILNLNKGIADYISLSRKYRPEVAHIICTHPLIPISCKGAIDMYLGFDFNAIPDNVDAVALKVMFTGPWTGIYQHGWQGMAKKRYCWRDYGKEKNLELYGSETPPDYNLSAITVPIKIYYVEGDLFFTEQSYKDMLRMTPNVKEVFIIKKPFKHGNFITGSGTEKRLAADVLDTLRRETL